MLYIVVFVIVTAVTLNPIAGAGITWLVWIATQNTNTDPDKAYGEVDSDGDFGN